MKSLSSLRPAACVLSSAAALALSVALTGCAGFATTATPSPTAGLAFGGNVHGGQQPVSGSSVYLFAASNSGYGTAGTSILTAGPGVTRNQYGNYFATTDANGNFGFVNYSCPSASAQVYLVAIGGNPGLGGSINNPSISVIDAIGNCSNINTSSFFSINEVTTAAFVFAAQQFITSPTSVGAPSTNTAGLAVAFSLAQDLVNSANGTARTTNVAGTGSVPQAKLNTLGNIIAPCLNSAGSGSTACTSLFSAVTPSGGTRPSDTVGALLLIAQNPGNNVANINAQATATSPFQPSANVTNDFSIGITYSGGGMTAPGNIVIDAAGNAYVGNSPSTSGASGTDSIVGFGTNGRHPDRRHRLPHRHPRTQRPRYRQRRQHLVHRRWQRRQHGRPGRQAFKHRHSHLRLERRQHQRPPGGSPSTPPTTPTSATRTTARSPKSAPRAQTRSRSPVPILPIPLASALTAPATSSPPEPAQTPS